MAAATAIAPGIPAPAPALGPPGQPDIAYAPDRQKWQARTARRLTDGKGLPSSVPEGFPTKLTGNLAWDGQTVGETYKWTYELSKEHLDEIDKALGHFKCGF